MSVCGVCVFYHEVHVLDLYSEYKHMHAVHNLNMTALFPYLSTTSNSHTVSSSVTVTHCIQSALSTALGKERHGLVCSVSG